MRYALLNRLKYIVLSWAIVRLFCVVPTAFAQHPQEVRQTSFAEDYPKKGFVSGTSKSAIVTIKSVASISFEDREKTISPLGLDELIQYALERNPRLARATFAIDVARGRTIQAGLYPNPILSVTGDELGDRTGPGGIWTAPQFTQEIVTGRKLSISQAVAAKEVDQANLTLLSERYTVIANIRANYFEVVALQRRREILAGLTKLAEQSVASGQKLYDSGNLPKLDLIQLEVEFERIRAEQEFVEREIPAAFRRLSASVGVTRLPLQPLIDTLDLTLPDYDLDTARDIVINVHPEIRSAKVGIERSQLALRRAKVDPIPNVTLTSGYTRQNQNRSSDWMIGVSLPIPVWNRNQGNIMAAQADIGVAIQEVGRVENDLVDRLAISYRAYASAKKRAERYRDLLIPKAEETFKLSTEAFKGGQFEYLRVLQAQRSLSEARLEYNKSISDAWKAAGNLSGLLLEESWPPKLIPKQPVKP